MSRIFYNNQQILQGQPTPVFSENNTMVRYGERWSQQKDITMRGQLTGCNYTSLINSQINLLTTFNKDFQTFSVSPDDGQGPTEIYSQTPVYIKSLDFQPSSYSHIIDYTIELGTYPSSFFTGFYGVLEPSDEWQFQEGEDRRMEVVHTVSAKGFNTTNSASEALNNAKNFVLSRTGIQKYVAPAFVGMCHPTGMYLVEGPNEQIDRWNGTYSVTERYSADAFYGSNPLFRYSSEMDCSKEQYTTISINGTIEGGINTTPQKLRTSFLQKDIYSLALANYKDATGASNLQSQPISRSISENLKEGRVSFSYVYSNEPVQQTYFDYSSTVLVDDNDITTVTINGTIKGRGNLKSKNQNVQAFFNTINLFNLANSAYLANGSQLYILNPKKENYSITRNTMIGEIEISVSYTNKPVESTQFDSLDYTLNWIAPIKQVRTFPLLDNCSVDYKVFYLGFWNRAEFSINGTATRLCNVTESESSFRLKINSLCNYLSASYFSKSDKYIEENNVSINLNNNGDAEGGEFSMTWSAEQGSPANSSYTTISNL